MTARPSGRRHRSRRGLVLAILLAALAPIVTVASPAAAAPSLAGGINIATSTSPSVGAVTNFVFLPGANGPMLAVGKCGGVALGTIAGNWVGVSWTPLNSVYCQGDRGLLGIDIDPVARTTVYL